MQIKKLFVVVIVLIVIMVLITPSEKQKLITSHPTPEYRIYIPGISTQISQKRGVSAPASCGEIKKLRVSWTYSYYPISQMCPGVENVSMIQADTQMSIPVVSNSVWLMGFNEPDIMGWARQPATDAAANWRVIEEQNPNYLLAAPVPGSFMTYDELGWLREFRSSYITQFGTAPRLNALTVHIYFIYAKDAIKVVEQAIAFADSWNIPGVWVTEFGLPHGECGNYNEIVELSSFLNYLDGNPKVMRYAWFGARFDVSIPEPWYPSDWCDLSLINSAGQLTPFGTVYSGIK